MTEYEMMRFNEMLPEFYNKVDNDDTRQIEKLFDLTVSLQTAVQTEEFYKAFIIENRHMRLQLQLDKVREQYAGILKEVNYFINHEKDDEWAMRMIMIMNDSMFINWEK